MLNVPSESQYVEPQKLQNEPARTRLRCPDVGQYEVYLADIKH